jgi:hypothetical protein
MTNPPDQSRRLLLVSGFANAGLPQVIAGLQWPGLYSIPPNPADALEQAWRIDEQHLFHLFECTNYPLEYCLVSGPRANAVLMQISTSLDFMDVDDVAAAFDRSASAEELRITTFALGLSAGEQADEAILSRLQSAFLHSQPSIRLAAIDAAFVTGWEVFAADLNRLALTDSDSDVRGTAANALQDFGKSGTDQAIPPA